ncbi:hypothetical protein BMETH_1103_0 [methanotrophic bacterial endosymbiont of Bathymodiolus sp.]|nr:hypothetical protein BMETH_1103_0 [methanotrophic bacterial endosymbiont of Bathymodiolus sp.]
MLLSLLINSAPIIVAHNSPDYRVENVYANAQPLRLSRR